MPDGDHPAAPVPRSGRGRVGLAEGAKKCRGMRLCYSWWAARPIETLLITNILLPRRPRSKHFLFLLCRHLQPGAPEEEFCKFLASACPTLSGYPNPASRRNLA